MAEAQNMRGINADMMEKYEMTGNAERRDGHQEPHVAYCLLLQVHLTTLSVPCGDGPCKAEGFGSKMWGNEDFCQNSRLLSSRALRMQH